MISESKTLSEKEVYQHNISALREVANLIQSTLGPKGLDKMLIDKNGFVVVTNDGVTVLQEMAIEEPIAKIILAAAEQQVEECGDGTTTAVLLCGELLAQAHDLLEKGLHPTTIIEGFFIAKQLALTELNNIAIEVDISDEEILSKVAETSVSGKGAHVVSEAIIRDLAVDAIQGVTVDDTVDLGAIKIDKKVGGTTSKMQVYDGALVEPDEPLHNDMARSIPEANILLLNCSLDRNKLDTDLTLDIGDTSQLSDFQKYEDDLAKHKAQHLAECGVDVVFFTNSSDDVLRHGLSNHDIMAVQTSGATLRFLKKVVEGRLVTNLDHISSADLGHGNIDYDSDLGSLNVFGDAPTGVTISIRGANEPLIDELDRSITDATEAAGRSVSDGRVLIGGGATETEISRRLRLYSTDITGRKQLAVNRFANALEIIPRTLASNSGMDETDTILSLRNQHAEGNFHAGIDAYSQTTENMEQRGVLEPFSQKAQAIEIATEVVLTILRVDGVIQLDHGFSYSDESEDSMP